MDGGDISSFVTNGEWDLIGNNNQLVPRRHRCAPFDTSLFASFSFYHEEWGCLLRLFCNF